MKIFFYHASQRLARFVMVSPKNGKLYKAMDVFVFTAVGQMMPFGVCLTHM
jgi:hypothetical protein